MATKKKTAAKKTAVSAEDQLELDVRREVLTDLYEVMGIDDGIEIATATIEEIEVELKEVASELEPSDMIAPASRQLLTELGIEVPKAEEKMKKKAAPKKAAPKKAAPVEEEDEDDADAEDDAEEEAPKKATPKKTGPKKTSGPTKKSVILEMVGKKPVAIKDIAEAIAARGIDDDVKKNINTIKLWIPKLGVKVLLDKAAQTVVLG